MKVVAASKAADEVNLRCSCSNGGFKVSIRYQTARRPIQKYRALLNRVICSLLNGEDIEVVDVCDNAVAPTANDQFRSSFVQQPGDLTREMSFAT
ncbi:hypothetical protein [Pelagibius sp.]|uniref:hypothetical protein n=1 Tax=Pelagibius sp. TaxID=1931238 RepID=UPI003BB16423